MNSANSRAVFTVSWALLRVPEATIATTDMSSPSWGSHGPAPRVEEGVRYWKGTLSLRWYQCALWGKQRRTEQWLRPEKTGQGLHLKKDYPQGLLRGGGLELIPEWPDWEMRFQARDLANAKVMTGETQARQWEEQEEGRGVCSLVSAGEELWGRQSGPDQDALQTWQRRLSFLPSAVGRPGGQLIHSLWHLKHTVWGFLVKGAQN